METSGLDPEITICKIVVFPIKLCPPCLPTGEVAAKQIDDFTTFLVLARASPT